MPGPDTSGPGPDARAAAEEEAPPTTAGDTLRRRRLSARERRLKLVLRRLQERARATPGPAPPGLSKAIQDFSRRLDKVHRMQDQPTRPRTDKRP